ncbi:MAG: oxidoreductase [Acidobacteria bacterium]|nr:oxidoreductase [Acidobacteriota bacterium]
MRISYLVSVLCVGLAVFAAVPAQTPQLTPEQAVGGKLDAPVRIEVFSDFQCPACRGFFLDSIQKVLENYCSQDKVCVIYHEFPLKNHNLARLAARYSKAAQRLGRKQWLTVMGALYTNQAEWTWDGSVDAVISRTLSPQDFAELKKRLEDPSIDTAIDQEVALGEKRQVTSTPTFFLSSGGKEERVVGGVPYVVLKGYIDRLIG